MHIDMYIHIWASQEVVNSFFFFCNIYELVKLFQPEMEILVV